MMLFSHHDIQMLNLVNVQNRKNPGYPLDRKHTYLELFFSPKNDVLIVGVVDNNYIYWASLTKTNETEKNAAIFGEIAKGQFTSVSALHCVLSNVSLTYAELKHWHHVEHRRNPSGMFYTYGNPDEHASLFGNYISKYPDEVRKRCRAREAESAYFDVMHTYLEIISRYPENPLYYTQISEIIRIIQSDNYLLLSENIDIRQLYIQLQNKASERYNAYMTAVH